MIDKTMMRENIGDDLILIKRDDQVLFRMGRSQKWPFYWYLFPLKNGVKGDSIAHDQYRNDLAERVLHGDFIEYEDDHSNAEI